MAKKQLRHRAVSVRQHGFLVLFLNFVWFAVHVHGRLSERTSIFEIFDDFWQTDNQNNVVSNFLIIRHTHLSEKNIEVSIRTADRMNNSFAIRTARDTVRVSS